MGCAVKPKTSAAASCDLFVARLHHFKGQAEGLNVCVLPPAKKRKPMSEKRPCQERKFDYNLSRVFLTVFPVEGQNTSTFFLVMLMFC